MMKYNVKSVLLALAFAANCGNAPLLAAGDDDAMSQGGSQMAVAKSVTVNKGKSYLSPCVKVTALVALLFAGMHEMHIVNLSPAHIQELFYAWSQTTEGANAIAQCADAAAQWCNATCVDIQGTAYHPIELIKQYCGDFASLFAGVCSSNMANITQFLEYNGCGTEVFGVCNITQG
jgi:hypothetical protein